MNEHENEHRDQERSQDVTVFETTNACGARRKGDLVVDLSRVKQLDLASLTLLLTAQQKAKEEDRAVWLVGVPLNVWKALDAMGLGKFFKAFPVSKELTV